MELSLRQQQDLERLLAHVPNPSDNKNIFSLCIEQPEFISKLLDNYQQKLKAIQNEDADTVKKIIEDEQQMINSIPS